MTRQTVTARARGREVPSKRGATFQIVVPCTREQRDAVRAKAVENCRSLGNEALYRIMQTLKAEEVS